MFKTPRLINGIPSAFMDVLRFLAAVTVFLTHARAVWFPEGELDALPSNISHGAVVVFFVLSGFVIAHTTTMKNRGPKEYAVVRLSRLYSVFLPAMAITAICLFAISKLNAGIYLPYKQSNMPFRMLVSVLFCNEIWFFSAAPLLDGPIWSLSYEFWYYVIFGAMFFRFKGAKGWILPVIVCLIAGPKILAMMFMWWLGWLVYHLPRPRISKATSWLLIMGCLAVAVYLMIYMPSYPHEINTTKWHWADKFLSDWTVSLFIGALFYLLPDGNNEVPPGVLNIIRKTGDMTFPIYVLHFPFLVLSMCFITGADKQANFAISLIIVFAMCCITGLFLESKRKSWTKFFGFIIK